MSRRQRQKPPKRTIADKTREAFYALALDWVDIHTRLPAPAQTDQHVRRSTSKEYGHPAEWASDKSAQIAAIFWSWHEMMAEKRNEHIPPSSTCEQIRVVNAWKYLEPRFDELVELVDDDAFTEIQALHYAIERGLGKYTPPQQLPVRCQNHECGKRTMFRRIKVGEDLIICASCGYTVPEERYPFLVRIILGELLTGVT